MGKSVRDPATYWLRCGAPEPAPDGAPNSNGTPGAPPRIAWSRLLLRPAIAIPVLIVVVVGAAPFVYRSARTAGLPRIAPPFDVEAAGKIEFAPDENAAPLYQAAAAALVPYGDVHPVDGLSIDYDRALRFGWEGASPEMRDVVRANRGALDAFRAASERPEFVAVQPGDAQLDAPPQKLLDDLHEFVRLGTIEGTRIESEGNVAGAWTWYRAAIRCSRHPALHGMLVDRLRSKAMLATVAPHAARWAGNPAVDAALLRRAFGELQGDLDLTPPASESWRNEYLALRNMLHRPDRSPAAVAAFAASGGPSSSAPTGRVAYFLADEPKLSDLVLRHVYANLLAYVDRPRWDRPPWAFGDLGMFEPPPGDLPDVLPPGELAPFVERTIFAKLDLRHVPGLDAHLRGDEAHVLLLRTAFAAQLAFRETGRYPERVQDLVPRYLPQVPRDPYEATGAPLRLGLGAGGRLKTWSVGSDGADDGGQPMTLRRPDPYKGDVVFDAAPVEVPPPGAEDPDDGPPKY